MKKKKQLSSLNITQKADLYTQLSKMEDAGFSHVQAFNSLIESGSAHSAKLYQSMNSLRAGHSIAKSGYRAGLFNELDQELITAGEFSGQLEHIYQQLATYYGDKARRIKKIKSRLFLPLSILILALFIQPVSALIIGKISGLEYLLTSIGTFAYLFFLMYLCWRLPYLFTEGVLRFLGLRKFVFQLQLTLPVVAPWIIRRQIKEFLLLLGLMLDAGVPIIEALPKAANTVRNALLAERIGKAYHSIQAGNNLTEALMQVKEFNSSTLQIIAVGEQSGKLAENLLHFAKLEAEVISLQEEMLAEWVPRLIYFTITIWIAYSIVTAYQVYFSTLDQTISNLTYCCTSGLTPSPVNAGRYTMQPDNTLNYDIK